MKEFESKKVRSVFWVTIVCGIASAAFFAAALLVTALSDHAPAAADGVVVAILSVCGVLLSAWLVRSILKIHKQAHSEFEFQTALLQVLQDHTIIRYYADKGIAFIMGSPTLAGTPALTGELTNAGSPANAESPANAGQTDDIADVMKLPDIINKQEYDALIEKLFANKHEFEENIYMAPDGQRWFRITTCQSGSTVITAIRDVTRYVEKISIINNLRYYDSITGLMSKQALSDMLKLKTEQGYRSIGIVHFSVIGIDKISSFEGADTADDIMAKLAAAVKEYESSQSMSTGRTAGNGITAVISNNNFEFYDYYDLVIKIYRSITNAVNELAGNVNRFINIFCGYAIYTDNETDVEKMLAEADFAAFDAQKQNSSDPVRYDPQSFKDSENEFGKIKTFNEILTNDLIDYHYQPIVNVRTGDVYGYEALMRPHEVNGIRLSPLEFLAIAQDQNMLGRVEYLTLSKTLQILSENQDVFHDKRLFVNSVSCVTLPEVEYLGLTNIYGELFPKLVIEITESNKLSDNIIPMINKYFRPHKAHVALDDYGAGYSNERTLLDVMPNYIKIDRDLITDIHSDEHKKQLVSNIVSYAATHGVYSLAEGVETEEELETVIFLGVDLIQGYFTCRPVPIFIHEIDSDIRSLVVKYSVLHAKRDDRVYEVHDDSPVDLVNLAVFGYTDIVVNHGSVNFYGDTKTTLNMRIICRDDLSVLMKFKDVRLHNDDYPVLEIGENSSFTLHVEGDNILSNQGIRVPASSALTLNGDGNLTIDCSHADGVCLGGNSTQSFGRIDLNTTGLVKLTNKCDRCVCIGGGVGTKVGMININSGIFTLHARGIDVLGIGALEGDVLVILNDCKIIADVSGLNTVAVGSLSGNAEVRSSADISITGTGNNCCLIGTEKGENACVKLHKGSVDITASGMNITGVGSISGRVDIESNVDITIESAGDNCCLIGTHNGKDSSLLINDGAVKITCNAKNIVAVGTFSGSCGIDLRSGLFDLLCEGNSALCVGNIHGSGDINLGGVVLNAVSNSALSCNIATADGKIVITSGNIFSNSVDDVRAYSVAGSRLVCRHLPAGGGGFESGGGSGGGGDVGGGSESGGGVVDLKVSDNGSVYRYVAKPSKLFDGYYVYLPEGTSGTN